MIHHGVRGDDVSAHRIHGLVKVITFARWRHFRRQGNEIARSFALLYYPHIIYYGMGVYMVEVEATCVQFDQGKEFQPQRGDSSYSDQSARL